jgi:hypothetical protein
MAYRYAFAWSLAVAALLVGTSGPARAQCRLCDNPTTERDKGDSSRLIRLKVETTLDFDRLVLLGAGDGSATLLPTGERSASGSVATVSAGAMVGRVVVSGEPGRTVRVDLPARIHLYSLGGSTILIDRIETDLSGLPKLDSSGTLSFRFGGRLQVTGDSEGEYRGDVPITVDYL